jgi:ABC-type sugar transport system substrate-binding protein
MIATQTMIRAFLLLLVCGISASCDREAPPSQASTADTSSSSATAQPTQSSTPPPLVIGRPAAPSGIAQAAQTTSIILLLQDTRIPFQQFQRDGLAMLVGRQKGCELTVHDAAGSAGQQADQFRTAITAKPSAIFVSPIDPPALAALIVEAKTAGIRVIGLDKRMLDEGCTSIVFTDQRRVGRLAAETVLDALKRKAAEEGATETTGRVVQIRGIEDAFPNNELAAGFEEELKKESGVILVHDAPADWKPENATARTAEAFRLQKQFDVIFAHNDALAMGAAKATIEAGERENVFIVGTDGLTGTKRGMELVRIGDIDATIVQPALVDFALQIILKLRDEPDFKPQPAYEVEPFAVVPKNVESALRVGTYKFPGL